MKSAHRHLLRSCFRQLHAVVADVKQQHWQDSETLVLKPYFSLDNSSIIDGKTKSFHRKHFILLSYFVFEPIHKAHRRGQPRRTSLFLLTEQKIAFTSPAKRPEKDRSSPRHWESFWRTTVDASLFATINILSLGQVETTTWPIVPMSIGRDISVINGDSRIAAIGKDKIYHVR
jgi:hypothetical protein